MHCPHCLAPVAGDRDFCPQCRNYLRWELTGARPAVAAAPPAPRPAAAEPSAPARPAPPTRRHTSPPRPRRAVQLTLARADDDGAEPSTPVRCEVVPGERVSLRATVRNRGTVTERFELAVSGLPAGWWTVTPAKQHLNPFGTKEPWDGEFELCLQPPRSPLAEARDWPLEVFVIADGSTRAVARDTATLRIAPYADHALTLRPARRAGRRRARFALALENRANAPVELALDAADDEQACPAACVPPRLRVPAGAAGKAELRVRAPRAIWIGRPLDRPVTVQARPLDGGRPCAPVVGVFRQRPWLPWWLPIALAVLAALAVMVWKALPHPVTVPDLRGAPNPSAAGARLASSHLAMATQGRLDPAVPPGTVIGQFPAPGAHVPANTRATVTVATGSTQRTVPSVIGLTPQQAFGVLARAGLPLGAIQPTPDQFTAPITAQLPAAGARVRVGTPVTVSVRPGAATATATGTPTASAAPGADAQAPLAFDDGRNVLVAPAGGTPKPVTEASGTTTAAEPALSPDGRYVAYVVLDSTGRGQLWLASVATGAASAHRLALPGDLHRPAFSPDGTKLAYVRKDVASGGEICLVDASGSGPVHCLKPQGWNLDRPAWSPTAHAIAAVAAPGRNDRAGAVVAYSASGGGWTAAGPPQPLVGVQSVAWAPDGAHVAAIGFDAGYHLYLFRADPDAGLTGGGTAVTAVSGCQLGYRPDGMLAVSVWDCESARDAVIVLVDPRNPDRQQVIAHGFDPAYPPRRAG